MTGFPELAPGVRVSGQIRAEDLPALREAGIRRIINNRPDGEEPGQPTAADMRRAAEAVGLDYVYAPIRGMPAAAEVAAMTEALTGEGPVLIHCKSGLRSAAAWAMAVRGDGSMTRDEVVAAGASSGFDLSRLPL